LSPSTTTTSLPASTATSPPRRPPPRLDHPSARRCRHRSTPQSTACKCSAPSLPSFLSPALNLFNE
jgi:hypothetical protein